MSGHGYVFVLVVSFKTGSLDVDYVILRDPPASAFSVLRFKVCATTTWPHIEQLLVRKYSGKSEIYVHKTWSFLYLT